MKVILLVFLLSFTFISILLAQESKPDSASVKTKIAIADARNFKPSKAIRLARRKRHLLNTSDYFMPTTNVSNPQFLKDSVYVQAYKDAAYKKSVYGSISHIHYTPDLSTEHIVKVVVAGAVVIVGTVLFLNYFVKNLIK